MKKDCHIYKKTYINRTNVFIIIISYLKYLKTCYGTDSHRQPGSQVRNGLIHFLLNSTTVFSLQYYVRMLSMILYRKYMTDELVMLEMSHQKN